MPSFGDNLKKLRGEQKLSQSELAQLVKMHPTHISRYERGQAAPSIDVVRRIAEVLEVSIDNLVFGNNTDIENGVSDRELVSLFKKVQNLSDRQKDTVKDFLSAFVLTQDLKNKLA